MAKKKIEEIIEEEIDEQESNLISDARKKGKKSTDKTDLSNFESDIIEFINADKKLGIEAGFLPQTGANIKFHFDTGSYTWNFITSGNLKRGIPSGRIIESHGDSYTGKSLLATQVAISAQLQNAIVIYFDIEKGFNSDFVQKLGGNPNTIIVPTRVRTIEQFNEGFVKILQMIGAKYDATEESQRRPVYVVLDSLAMLSTKKEIESPEKQDFTKPKKIKQFFRMYMDDCARYDITLFVINQVYDNIGVMFGPAKKVSGGQGLPYAATIRYNMLTPVIETDDQGNTATKIKAKTIKNRISIPFRSAFIRFTYKNGVDRYGGLWELLTDGDGKKVTGLKIIESVSRDKKTNEWVKVESGKTYRIPDFRDENGEEVTFSKKDFVNVLKQYGENIIDHIQKIIDERHAYDEPEFDSLSDEEKIIAGIMEDGVMPTDEELAKLEMSDYE